MPCTHKAKPPGLRLEHAAEESHEGARSAGSAQGTVDETGSRGRIVVGVESELEGRVGDRHQQTCGDAVATGVANEQGDPSIG